MFQIYCRIYQIIFKIVSKVLPWREPELVEGIGSTKELPKAIKNEGIHKVLLVTDQIIEGLGLIDDLYEALKIENIDYTTYNKTVPNPTIDNIEEALAIYHTQKCKGIIAFGGGSSMDCAKGVAARVARPNKSIPQLKGVLRVLKKTPKIFTVPTTAGTGSEATIAAVITNAKTHEKYAINDPVLIPHYAVLDPTLTVNLPKHITSTTGMDALTHAVEAYIGKSNTKETIELSRKAVKLIFENIETAYHKGTELKARENMLKASYFAGVSFTRAYVGYVHAIAHTLGGFYNTPHGLANAVILPHVLEYYGEAVHKPLSELSDLVGLSSENDTNMIKSKKFIKAIKDLNDQMAIPSRISDIDSKDIPLMVKRAFKESNPLYPVPKYFTKEDFTNIYEIIRG